MYAGSIPARASTLSFTRDCAALAQLVEHIIRNDGVTGSNPVSGTTSFSLVFCGFEANVLLIEGRSLAY